MVPLHIHRFHTQDEGFETAFQRLLHWPDADFSRIQNVVADILDQVRREGDSALIRLTGIYDRVQLLEGGLAFQQEELEQAVQQCAPQDLKALELAAQRIRDFHLWQMPPMGLQTFRDPQGVLLGQRSQPLHRVGLYVPGGLASYPSSVLMNAIPARVAGVKQLVMTVPTPDGILNPLILAAARIAGVDEIYRVGGAQAVAAMAFGTQTIRPVDKIVGPGNAYVAMAKRLVFGQVGIDMLAGPSEILVIADANNNPEWLAADMLSQAEHDTSAQSILLTDDPPLADAVSLALARQLPTLARREICAQSLAQRGAIVVTRSLEEACRLASRVAPEHLELAVADPESLLGWIENAGAIFLGPYTPEPIGDYVAGPNHVLPTSQTARFSSPLGVFDFIKRSSIIGCSREALAAIGPAASTLAAAEGLTAHQRSVDLRLETPR